MHNGGTSMVAQFDSIRSYGQFVGAKEFWNAELENGPFDYERNWGENAGSAMIYLVNRGTDLSLRNLTNPVIVPVLGTLAVGIATLVWYPDETIQVIEDVLPDGLITPERIKLVSYLTSLDVITGVVMRAIGRMSNKNLSTAWNTQKIVPIQLGTTIVPAPPPK
jgi:hypothetical protein